MNTKERLRGLASQIIVRSGISRVGRQIGDKNGAYILYGHRVADNDDGYLEGLRPDYFEAQLRYLTRHYQVIPLGTLIEALASNTPVPERSVVLTFDDGFRDNYEIAFPLLQKFGVPATVFVVTDSLSDGALPWAQQIGVMLQNTNAKTLNLPVFSQTAFELGTEMQRKQAFHRLLKHIGPLRKDSREGVLGQLKEQLNVTPPIDQMMTWDQAREMQAAGHEIGAHTCSHALMGQIPADEAEAELTGCKAALKREMDLDNPSFCFPGGSLNTALLQRVEALGFTGCFIPGQNVRINQKDKVTAFSMSRIGLPEAPSVNLEAEMDGPFHTLRKILRTSRGSASATVRPDTT